MGYANSTVSKIALSVTAGFCVLGVLVWQITRQLESSTPQHEAWLSAPITPKPAPKLNAQDEKYFRLTDLGQSAKNSLQAGDTKAATKFAIRLLRSNTERDAWYYGNIVHEANQIIGLAALREGRVADAKHSLLAAGKTPGSPQLDSFGPNMVLARQLLARGEKRTVIDYLDLVAKFWAYTPEEKLKRIDKLSPGYAALSRRLNKQHAKTISEWKHQIRTGKKPSLNSSHQFFP